MTEEAVKAAPATTVPVQTAAIPHLTGLSITHDPVTGNVFEVQFYAHGKYSDGSVKMIPAGNVKWDSQNPSVIAISPLGLATAYQANKLTTIVAQTPDPKTGTQVASLAIQLPQSIALNHAANDMLKNLAVWIAASLTSGSRESLHEAIDKFVSMREKLTPEQLTNA